MNSQISVHNKSIKKDNIETNFSILLFQLLKPTGLIILLVQEFFNQKPSVCTWLKLDWYELWNYERVLKVCLYIDRWETFRIGAGPSGASIIGSLFSTLNWY